MALSNLEIADKFVKLCQEGKNVECIDTFYVDDTVSVEAFAPPGVDRTVRGLAGIRGKHEWWVNNHVVHTAETYGPYPHGDDKFAVRFVYDITQKQTDKRLTMDEVAVYTVANGKIVREEYFYKGG